MRKFLLLLLMLLMPMTAEAQIRNLIALGFAQFTVAASTALPNIPSGASEAFIVCTGQPVMWRDDGVAPTATIGVPLPVNTGLPYIGSLANMRIIQTTTTATCNVSYYQ